MGLKYLNKYRDRDICRKLIDRIRSVSRKPVRIMEVCGTHTMAIARNGIRGLLPDTITLLSGPGCPVCVTAQPELDRFIHTARMENVTVATFGDLLRVPASKSSLETERGQGADVRIVYSPMDALDIAEGFPRREVVFPGVGFETTAPAIAAVICAAKEKGLGNFSVLSANKRVLPALQALMDDGDVSVDGFICPGHVSTIIGTEGYERFANDNRVPCVVTGFEPVDILLGIYLLIRQIESGRSEVENAYRRGVSAEGNARALEMMDRVFRIEDGQWRGIGRIPDSGLKIGDMYSDFDTVEKFDLPEFPAEEIPGCACGDILKGIRTPEQCVLYGKMCTPGHPVGPCMVSSEGSCAAYYKYRMDTDEKVISQKRAKAG